MSGPVDERVLQQVVALLRQEGVPPSLLRRIEHMARTAPQARLAEVSFQRGVVVRWHSSGPGRTTLLDLLRRAERVTSGAEPGTHTPAGVRAGNGPETTSGVSGQ